MYRVTYGEKTLHDPRTDDFLLVDLSLEQNVNECGYCDFVILRNHPHRAELRELDTSNPVRVFNDEALIFQGFIYELGKDFLTSGVVKCKGDLALLASSIVRPYSTVAGTYPNTAPSTVDGYFKWLIDQHNEQVDESKRFAIGVNEGSILDKNNHILRESKQLPTTAQELSEKVISNLGGYLFVRYPDGVRTIDLMAECYDVNAQVFDFGVNLMDYKETNDALEVFTAVVPTGATPEGGGDKALPLGIDGLADGVYVKDSDYIKQGDMVYCSSAVERYGMIVGTYSNDDITTAKELLDAAVIALKMKVSPITTIEIKAVDLSLVNSDYKPLRIGEYVRVRSKPHDFDSYMLCTNIEPDLNNPENSMYTLGTTFDTITGQQNKRINELNATINKTYEKAEEISQEAKDAANKANAAVLSSYDEYAMNQSSAEPPKEGWSKETPSWKKGWYIWRRSVTKHGNGKVYIGAPAVMTGGDGEDATLLRVDSSRGTVFKNNAVNTTLSAVVYHGSKRISDINALKAEYGTTARIEWSWQRMDEDRFGIISADDSRLTQGGMALVIGAADVDTKCVFMAKLITD